MQRIQCHSHRGVIVDIIYTIIMKYFYALILSCIAINLFAQEDNNIKSRKRLPFEFGFYPGVYVINASNLNVMLEEADTDKVSRFGANATFTTAYRFQKLIAGISLTPSMSFKDKNSLRSSDFTFYLSTNAIQTGNTVFSPQIGLGYQQVEFTLDKQGTSTNFEDYLTSASNQTKMEHNSTMADFNITIKKTNTTRTVFRPQFRFGYKTSISQETWEIRNADVNNAPKDGLGTFYAQLAIGIGW